MIEKILEKLYGPLDNYRAEPGNYEDLLRVEKELENKKFLKRYTNLYKEFRKTKLMSGFSPDIPLEKQVRKESVYEFVDRHDLKREFFTNPSKRDIIYKKYFKKRKLVKI